MGNDPLSRLADIDLPAPPDWQPWLLGAGAVLVLTPPALWLGWRLWRRLTRRRASRIAPRLAAAQIDGLLHRWREGGIDDREAGYRLAAVLRLGLGMDQLDERCPTALAAYRGQWAETVAALSRLRYRATPAGGLRTDDFLRIKGWLTASSDPRTREPRTRP